MKSILKKLNAKTRTEAVIKAIQRGIIDLLYLPCCRRMTFIDALYYDNTPAKLFTKKIRDKIENLYNVHKKKETL